MGDRQLDSLWKSFGRESEAGKILFRLYKAPNKPKINYPPVKTQKKPLPFEESKAKPKATAQVNYPDLPRPKRRKFHPIDFVPKRKNQQDIQFDIESNYRDVNPPPKRGTNREALKQNLQERFLEGGKALPKGAMLPQAKRGVTSERNLSQGPARKPRPQIPDNAEGLYDMIIEEIEERQEFLTQMQALGQLTKEIEDRVKGEMASRFSEIDRLKKLI